METTTIELDKRACKPSYGGMRLEVEYLMRHTKNGRVNLYRVTCEIEGLRQADPHLSVRDAEFVGDLETESNDETLTNDAASVLFEDNFIV